MDRGYGGMQPNGRSQRATFNRSTDQAQRDWRNNWHNQEASHYGRSLDREMPVKSDHYNKQLAVYPGCESTAGSSSSADRHSSSNHLDKVKKRYKTVPKVLKIFAERTSCVGPPYILTSKSWYSTAFWAILFLAAVGMTIYQLTENFTMYFNFPVKTTLSLDYKALPFPMVTICNTNPIKRSRMNMASEDLKEFLGILNPAKFERKRPPPKAAPHSSNSQPPAGNGRERRKRFIDRDQIKTARGQNKSSFRPRAMDEKFLGGNEHPMTSMLSEFKYLYGQEDSSNREVMGHQIEDMLISCSFEGRECDEADFTLITTTEYGNCYIFNQKNVTVTSTNTSHILSKRPGSQHGLQLMLYLEVNEYIPGLTLGYGTRVSVSHPGTMAFPAIDGVFVSAGMETDIGTKMLEVSRLSSPYGDCIDHDWFTKQYNYLYTKHACQETCVYRKILDTCKCVLLSSEEYFPNHRSSFNSCRTDDDYNCASTIIYQVIQERNITCECNNSCQDTVYDLQMSSRGWPVDSYLDMLIDSVCRSQKTDLDTHCNRLMDLDDQTTRKNFLKLNIFYRDLNYQKLVEEPDYPRSQFLSDLGGSIGLWIGLSVLSVAELLQLVIELTKAFYKSCRYAGQIEKQTSKKKQDFSNISNINGHEMHQPNMPEPKLDYPTAPTVYWDSTSN